MSLKSICFFSISLPPIPSSSDAIIARPFFFPSKNTIQYSSPCRLSHRLHSSNKLDSSTLSSDDDDNNHDSEPEQPILDVEIEIDIEKTGTNRRKIRSEVNIEAPLTTVWNLLTDYERLADFIPGLAVCKLLDKKENYARLFQIGEQDLALGLKFNAKGILDCYETPLQSIPDDLGGWTEKRDIEFNMVEGDFEIFQGKWALQQLNGSEDISCDSLVDKQMQTITTLRYSVDVKPKLWLPVRLVEGRLCKEIKLNLACVRQEALRITRQSKLLF